MVSEVRVTDRGKDAQSHERSTTKKGEEQRQNDRRGRGEKGGGRKREGEGKIEYKMGTEGKRKERQKHRQKEEGERDRGREKRKKDTKKEEKNDQMQGCKCRRKCGGCYRKSRLVTRTRESCACMAPRVEGVATRKRYTR